jgi:hypothetical protein
VIAPTGNTIGWTIVLEMISAKVRIKAPIIAEAGISS